MLTQCISATCTLGLVILAILVITRAVSLEDALNAIGKALLVLVLVLAAVCLVGPLVRAGMAALTLLVETVIPWLLVTVLVVAVVILCLRTLLWRSGARPEARGRRDRGEM